METRIRTISTNVVVALAMAVAVAGCFDSGASSVRVAEQKGSILASEPRQDPVETAPPAWVRGEQPVLRYRTDAARERVWILTRDGVDLYDAKTRAKVASIELPRWTWVNEEFSCSPELALGPAGEALVTSNIVPTVWRIDPSTLSVSTHELVLDADTDREVGFTGMAYAPQQGAFFAVSGFGGSLWRIDPLLRRAQKIPLSLPLANACALALRFQEVRPKNARLVNLCVRAENGGRATDLKLLLAPDQRSGYVSSGSCES